MHSRCKQMRGKQTLSSPNASLVVEEHIVGRRGTGRWSVTNDLSLYDQKTSSKEH